MLQPDRAVCHHRQRLPFDLGVAICHGDRLLFMAARDQLGGFVAAIVDDRFVQRAEARSWIGADEFEPERLQHVHHEIRTRTVRSQDLDRGGYGLGFLG